jgi:hypothetical protein
LNSANNLDFPDRSKLTFRPFFGARLARAANSRFCFFKKNSPLTLGVLNGRFRALRDLKISSAVAGYEWVCRNASAQGGIEKLAWASDLQGRRLERVE